MRIIENRAWPGFIAIAYFENYEFKN